MERKRILIGSCGGATGSYLARLLRKKGEYYIIGADASAHHGTRPFLDECIVLPGASKDSFCESLISALNQHKIDYYLPTHSQEIRMVSKYEVRIREMWGGHFLVSPYETFLKLDDKNAANDALRNIDIPVPKQIAMPSDDISYPIFMKPNVGSGGKKAQSIETLALHREYARIYPDCSFYEQISGEEFTVDCMFDDQGKLLAYNQRIRMKNMGGAVVITKNDYRFDILPFLKKLENSFVIKGCINFQYILCNEIPYFIDINLRYASGGLPLTVESGIDVVQIMLDIWERKDLSEIYSCPAERKTMYRYFNEWYEDTFE